MKINLHCHSNYSDGYETVSTMAEEHKKLGYSAFVVTDHCYPFLVKKDLEDGRMLTSFKKFSRQTKELEKVSKELDYPCLQGIELAFYGEEVLVFGTEVIKEIFDYLENIDLKEQEKYGNSKEYSQKLNKHLIEILKKNKNSSATILCHPHLVQNSKSFEDALFSLVDGYEFQNGRSYFFTDDTNSDKKTRYYREIPQGLRDKKKFYNSDAHSVRQITSNDGNFHKTEIKTIEDLIGFIKEPTDLNLIKNMKFSKNRGSRNE